MTAARPGLVILFGSGETSNAGGRAFERAAQWLERRPNVALLETPAGFEPNSALVAGRVKDFLQRRLQNYAPEVNLIPARRRGTPHSPDLPEIVAPLRHANLIFMGAGSPTYAARQLRDSLAWHWLLARHHLGAVTALASAATLVVGTHVLPVYEIYKVGEDLHWRGGLDFFSAYNLKLTIIPHWNNAEGGAELDTSHCFVGEARYARLAQMLPPEVTVVGLDEHTALVLDMEAGQAQVLGRGAVTLMCAEEIQRFSNEQSFPLTELGPFQPAAPGAGVPAEVWAAAQAAADEPEAPPPVPAEVQSLAQERQAARQRRDWAAADQLRDRLAELGWNVLDTPAGPRLERR